MKRQRYSAQAKQNFRQRLSEYDAALDAAARGDKSALLRTSVAVRAALADVPKGYSRLVSQAFKKERSC